MNIQSFSCVLFFFGMTDGTTRVNAHRGGKITSNIFILFGKARENKCTARDREGGQVEVSHLQQAC